MLQRVLNSVLYRKKCIKQNSVNKYSHKIKKKKKKSWHLQIETVLLLPFQFWCLLFLFLAHLLWLGLPVPCWVGVVRVGSLVLFLNSEEKLSAFLHWVCARCGLMICGIYYIETLMIFCFFFFHSINVVCHIDWVCGGWTILVRRVLYYFLFFFKFFLE